MIALVELVYLLTPEMALLRYEGDEALWVAIKVRKPTTCAASGKPIAPGDEAFRPLGNQKYRGQRVRAELVRDVAALGDQS